MTSSMSLKNPRTGSEVTKEWLEVVLSQYESKTCPGSTVKVGSFEVNPGCAKGDNFNSDVMRIVTKAQVTSAGGTSSPAHYSFIVKFLLGNELQQAAIMYSGSPKRELLTLSEILPALNTFQKERTGDKYPINAPEYVYGVCADGQYALVMQDFREAGFKVEGKRRGLSFLQLKTAVRDLAHLHAISYAFSSTDDFLARYPDFKVNALVSRGIGAFVQVVIEGLQDAFRGRKEEFPGLLEALISNKDKLVSKITDILTVSGKEPMVCLSHGDFWTNNIMFRYNKEGVVEDFAMIDWGNVGWRNPIFDLQYLIQTSTQQAVRRNHLKELQTYYYDTFISVAANLGAVLPLWTFEDFLVEWQKSAGAGMIFGVIVNLITLSESGRKFERGTLTTGFLSRLRFSLGKMLISMPGSWVAKMTYWALKKEWKTYFLDLASMNNLEMTSRVTNLVTEAFENGVLDP